MKKGEATVRQKPVRLFTYRSNQSHLRIPAGWSWSCEILQEVRLSQDQEKCGDNVVMMPL